MAPTIDFGKQITFLRQIVISSEKISKRDELNKDIEDHIERIKKISSKKQNIKNELEKLRDKIRIVVDKKKAVSVKDSSNDFPEKKIEEIETRLNEYHTKTKSSGKKILKKRIKVLEGDCNKLKKKYPKKDLKRIKNRIDSLKKKL